MFGQIYLNYNK